jgi:hypothetical protein
MCCATLGHAASDSPSRSTPSRRASSSSFVHVLSSICSSSSAVQCSVQSTCIISATTCCQACCCTGGWHIHAPERHTCCQASQFYSVRPCSTRFIHATHRSDRQRCYCLRKIVPMMTFRVLPCHRLFTSTR